MDIDSNALIVAVLGTACGVYYVVRYQKHITYLYCAWRIVIDESYSKGVIGSQTSITSPITNDQPYQNRGSYAATRSSIRTEYTVITKKLLYYLVRLCGIPFIASILLGQSITFLSALVISIVVLMLYIILFAHEKSYASKTQASIIQRHITGYSTSYTGEEQVSQPLYNSNKNNSLDVYAGNPVVDHPVSIVSDKKSIYDELYDTNHHISWQKLWWGNDAALSTILVVAFWLSNTGSLGDKLTGALQVVLFTQLFFVPVWGVITIAMKLFKRYQ